jgi:tetratricopeptide (TPR) repeat protein
MQAAARWQSRALFVSSTFEDMHAERDHLQQFVFPELEERLRAHRTHLACIDLRWGVETMSLADRETKEATVLKVCLAEIDRCRPYFVVLLGERYGWVPPVARVEAATKEAGLAREGSPCSVTELEVEYGALRTKQPVRPLFYFRRPLPYDRMSEQDIARYSDTTRTPQDFQRLEALKARIRDRYPDRLRQYSVDWDSNQNRPTGLAEFGRQVLEDLWSEFKPDLDSQPEVVGWQREESYLLDTFIEEGARACCGRVDLVEEILAKTSHSHKDSAFPALAIVAESGAGKSALLATIVQKLVQANETLVLAHSAGISPRSISVRNMLQRWCALLAAFLGVEDRSEDAAGPDEIKGYFAGLLRDASRRKRVVVLVDALDQFERTSEASYLTWLPRREDWPENAILIATTIPGTESGVLASKGAETLRLPALSVDEAAAIAERICADFHKTLPAAVRGALLNKRKFDEEKAAGNPLWLTLAVNELIVLDDDDFAQMPRFSGSAEERLVQLMVHVVGLIPADVHGAYDYVYDRVERTYGDTFVRSLMSFLSIARFGLREKDLQALVGSASGNAWLPSSFAAVRRALRAHLCERGRSGQWAFTHHQARSAAIDRYGATPETAGPLHQALSRHLRSLPGGDPLQLETMYHLICGRTQQEAGDYWTAAGADEELPAAFDILREYLLSSEQPSDAVMFPLSFLLTAYNRPQEDERATMGLLAGQRLLEFTEKTRLGQVSPTILRELLNGMIDMLRQRLGDHPGKAMEEEVLYRALQNLGLLQTDLGEIDAALLALTEAAEINERHAAGRKVIYERSGNEDPQARYVLELLYHENERDRMLTFQRIARLQIAKNEPEAARTSYERALEISQFFLKGYPESELATTDMAVNLYSLGDLSLDRDEFETAVEQYGAGLTGVLKVADRESSPLLLELTIAGYLGLARANTGRFHLQPAIQQYGAAVKALREAARRDPGDLDLQWRFLRANDEVADMIGLVHMPQGIDAAMQCYDNSLETCTTLLGTGYRSRSLFQYMQRCYEQKAVIAEIQGKFQLAQTFSDHARQVADWAETTQR